MIALSEQERKEMNAAYDRALVPLRQPTSTTQERLGAALAKSMPVRLGSPTNAEEFRKEWEYLLKGTTAAPTTPTSWWEQLLAAGKEYLLESEKIKAQRAVAEAEAAAKTAELPPAKEKAWLEKNFGWVLLGGVALVVTLTTVAAVK